MAITTNQLSRMVTSSISSVGFNPREVSHRSYRSVSRLQLHPLKNSIKRLVYSTGCYVPMLICQCDNLKGWIPIAIADTDIDRCEWLMPDDTSIQTDHSWNSTLRIYQFWQSAHNLHPLKYSLFHEWRVLMQLFAFKRVLPLDFSWLQQWKMAAGLATTKWTR